MVRFNGFLKGDRVEFQDYRHCWTQGTVSHVEPRSVTQTGPSGEITETRPAEVHVVYETEGKVRVARLNPKRVRHVEPRKVERLGSNNGGL